MNKEIKLMKLAQTEFIDSKNKKYLVETKGRRLTKWAKDQDIEKLELDEIRTKMMKDFPNWFIYQGGYHIALHRHGWSERFPRVMLIGLIHQ